MSQQFGWYCSIILQVWELARSIDLRASMNPWIQTENLKRYYERGPQTVRALDGVDLILNHGEFVSVVGSSGSGKSTLLNLLAGLDSPTSGRILVDGATFDGYTRKELAAYRAQKVGMMFQSFNLLPYKSALENVEVALYFNDTPKAERRVRATEMLSKLGLAERLTHHPADLSGGEQQRVALARALVKNPSVLLADEPTGNLDQENTKQIGELFTELNRNGLTIIMVSHDLALAQRLSQRIIQMDYGKIISDSATDTYNGQESML
ncbi:ABC transporter ATP-binding protein [Gemmatimonas aurantiaca]|nr:ABC transporter ATP-binding protein [Gemmatimonas aurantiaca]